MALVAAGFGVFSAPASAAGWSCEASAARVALLNQPLIEPAPANKGEAVCKTVTGVGSLLPAPLQVGTLSASTRSVGDTPATQAVAATGGLLDFSLKTLPNLGINLPVEQAIDAIPVVGLSAPGLPSGLTVDIRPAVRALVGGLPNLDLVGVRAATAYATGACTNGQPTLNGTSRVAGLTLLGQEVGADAVVSKVLELTSGRSVDPSTLDISQIKLPDGILPGLLPLAQSAIQPALDALPNIQLPAQLANVSVIPNQQLREGGKLIQRALTISVSVAGQRLADTIIGEAIVGQDQVVCGQPAPVAAAALECTTRRLVLIDVVERNGRVSFLGAADKRYIGRQVRIFFPHQRKYVATVKVAKDGTFRGTAALPARTLRGTNLARYQARVGNERSLRLKLRRRMMVQSVRVSGKRVRISGRVLRPLAAPSRTIVIKRRVSCKKNAVVARVKPKRDGTFSVTVDAPPSSQAAVYRLETRVRKTMRNPKTFPTFTLPRYVDLDT